MARHASNDKTSPDILTELSVPYKKKENYSANFDHDCTVQRWDLLNKSEKRQKNTHNLLQRPDLMSLYISLTVN